MLDVQRYSYESILQPIVSSLQRLESEQRVTVSLDGKNEVIRAIVILFSADKLGAHTLGLWKVLTPIISADFVNVIKHPFKILSGQ